MTYLKKAFKVFSNREKTKLYFILFFSIIGAFLEMVGITLCLPVLTVLLEGNFSEQSLSYLNLDLSFFDKYDIDNFLFFSLFLLVTAFFLKNIFLFVFNYYNNKFINDVGARISKDIFKKYLQKDFSFYLKKNSTELLNNCIYVIDGFKDTFHNIIIIISEFLVLLGIVLLLVLVEPRGFFLSLIFMASLGFLMFFLSGKVIEKWGRQIIGFEKERYLHLSQAFGGIREIKIFKKINFFFKKYLIPNENRFRISVLKAAFTSLPRYLIEVLFILTLALLLFFLKSYGKSNHEIIIIMGLFAIASIRVMPSLNRILSAYQSFKYGFKAINIVYEELSYSQSSSIINNRDVNFETDKNINDKNFIKLENVHYKYDISEKYILKDINLSINKKEFLGVIGRTGSGKSTLANLILGLLKPTKGNIILNFSKIGFVPQAPYLIDDTILNNIALGVDPDRIDNELVKRALKDVQLEKFIKSLPNGVNTYVGEKGTRISGGELQRLALARALYIKPDIVVLDEPTNSLDVITEKKIIDILNNLSENLTIILVTHNLNNLKHCDKVIKVDNNQIYFLEKNTIRNNKQL